ncbi:hypothetical protein BSKO_03011 [Bryopsis sp. KO-2023]|nr:hypothetical protein BSKO_03011 [Bryopsis sp. KO-2023]
MAPVVYERIRAHVLRSSSSGGPPESIFASSKDGTRLAVVFKGQASVLNLFQVENESIRSLSTWRPSENNEGGGISCCCWSPCGRLLAVGGECGTTWLFSKDLTLQVARSTPLGQGGLVGLAFVTFTELFAFGINGKVYEIPVDYGGDAAQVANVASYHGVVRGVAAHNDIFVVVGDGPKDAREGNGGESSIDNLQGLTVSIWKFSRKGATFIQSFGKKPSKGLLGSLWGRATKSSTACALAFSPDGELVAIAPTFGTVKVLSMNAGKLIGPEMADSSDLQQSLSGVQHVAWWSENVLSVASTTGEMIFVALPGFDIVAREVFVYPPNLASVCSHSVHRLISMEPVMSASSNDSWEGELHMLIEQTPQQMLDILLRKGCEEEALELAKEHGLGTDQVYRGLWSLHPVSHENMASNLDQIKDRQWVVSQCLERAAEDYPEERALLEYGLKQTELCCGDGLDEIPMDGSESAVFVKYRLKLLGALDRLETFVLITKGGYSDAAFAAFRDSNLVSVAMGFAATGNAKALEVLLERHTFTLFNHIFQILSELPETMDPHTVVHITPTVDSTPSAYYSGHRDPDWIETESTILFLIESQSDMETGMIGATEDIVKLRMLSTGAAEPKISDEMISEWCVERAAAMDIVTGQLGGIKVFLEMCYGKGIRGRVGETVQNVEVLSSTVRGTTGVWNIGLSEFSELGVLDKLVLVLGASTEQTLEQDLNEKIVILVGDLDRASRKEHISSLLTKEFKTRPGWVVKLVELETQEGMLFGVDQQGVVDFCQVVVSVVNEAPQDKEWEKLSALMDFVKASISHLATQNLVTGGLPMNSENQQENHVDSNGGHDPVIAEMVSKIERLNGVVVAGCILSRYGVALTVWKVRDLNSESALRTVRSLLSRASRAGRGWPRTKWDALWGDLQSLSGALCGLLDESVVLGEVCRAVLRAGAFGVAQEYLSADRTPSIEGNTAETLVLSVGREFLYSSSSLQDEAISDARKSFQLLPESEAANTELATLDALLELPQFGVTLLPMQLKQLPSRIDVIPHILQAQPDNYKDLDTLRGVAKLLGLDSHEEHVKVDLMIGQAALEAGDFEVAQEVSTGLAKEGPGAAWELCASVAVEGGERVGRDRRKTLLGFAVAHCPEDRLMDLVEALKSCDAEENGGAHAEAESTEQVFNRALATNPSSVPLQMDLLSMGDVSLALHALLDTRSSTFNHNTPHSFKSFQRATTLTLIARVFRMQSGKRPLEELIAMPVQELLSFARSNCGERLEEMKEIETVLGEIQAAEDARGMKGVMPGVDVMRFAGGDEKYRKELLTEQAAFAGEMLALGGESKNRAQVMFDRALDLAAKYAVERWGLTMAFLVSVIRSMEEITSCMEIMEEHRIEVLSRPDEFVEQLWSEVWEDISGDDWPKLACFLNLIDEGVEAAGKPSGKLRSIGSTVTKFGASLDGFDMKCIVLDSLNVQLGFERGLEVRNACLQEVYRFVSRKSVVALADMVDELANITNTPSAVTPSTVYGCLMLQQIELFMQNDSTSLPGSLVESEEFWRATFQKMSAEEILEFLQWCCLEGSQPYRDVVNLSDIAIDLPVNLRIWGLTAGVARLRMSSIADGDGVKALDKELRRLDALDSAQRLAGLSGTEFLELLQDDGEGPSGPALEKVVKQLLTSGSKLDVILEVAGSVARTGDAESSTSVPMQVTDILTENLGAALESLTQSDEPVFGSVLSVVNCLDLQISGVPEEVREVIDSAREVIWDRISIFCSGVEGDALVHDNVVKLFDLHGSLANGEVWQDWSRGGAAVGNAVRSKLLFSQTVAVLGDDSSLEFSWESFGTLSDCQALFSYMLREFGGSLTTLAELLKGVWNHGLVWTGPEDVGGGVGVVPLHSAWAELFLAMIEKGDVSGVLSALDSIREEAWVPPVDTNAEPCATLSLLLPGESGDVVRSLSNARHSVCAGLMAPFEELKKEALERISVAGCDGPTLGLLLEGDLLSGVMDSSEFEEALLEPLVDSAPHPSLIDFWEHCQEVRTRELQARRLEDASEPRPDQHGRAAETSAGPVAANARQDNHQGLDDEWNRDWEEEESLDENHANAREPDSSAVDAAEDNHDRNPENAPDADHMEDLLEEGWGDDEDETDWAETLRAAEQLATDQTNHPVATSPPVPASDEPSEGGGGDWGDGSDDEAWAETLRAAQELAGDQVDSNHAGPPMPASEDEVAWGDGSEEDEWTQTLREAAEMAQRQEEITSNQAGPSYEAAISRIAEEGLEPGMGDPGSGVEEGSGWDEDDGWDETLRAAGQLASDPPQNEAQEVQPDGGNPPGVDGVSVDGWDDDDDLGELLGAAGGEVEGNLEGPSTSARESNGGGGDGGSGGIDRIPSGDAEVDMDLNGSDDPPSPSGGNEVEDPVQRPQSQPLNEGTEVEEQPQEARLPEQPQEARLPQSDHGEVPSSSGGQEDWEGVVLLCSCLLPCLVACLCRSKRFTLAASMVSQKMGLHGSLNTIDGGLAILERYLVSVMGAPVDVGLYEQILRVSGMPYTTRRLLERMSQDCKEALAQLRTLVSS